MWLADERARVQTFLRHDPCSDDMDFECRRSLNREQAIHHYERHDEQREIFSVEETTPSTLPAC